MNILIAFDKFKDNMTAFEACKAAEEGICSSQTKGNIVLKPLTDGGEGFCEILTLTARGETQLEETTGPLSEKCNAPIGYVNIDDLPKIVREFLKLPQGAKKLAIIEMATAAGLEQVPSEKRNPWETSTRGIGKLLIEAKNKNADVILLGIGGSATNDMGTGMLQALGCIFNDSSAKSIENPTPETWSAIASINTQNSVQLPPIRIACDVSNPLLGERGATRVYGPQKGLKKDDLERMEKEFKQMSEKLCIAFGQNIEQREIPSSGAAGGIGFGLKLASDAEYIPGFELVNQWLNIEESVKKADIILTGEGKFDQSSLEGKGPGRILRLAKNLNKSIYILAGHIDSEIKNNETKTNIHIQSIEPENIPLEIALKTGKQNMKKTVYELFLNKDCD